METKLSSSYIEQPAAAGRFRDLHCAIIRSLLALHVSCHNRVDPAAVSFCNSNQYWTTNKLGQRAKESDNFVEKTVNVGSS